MEENSLQNKDIESGSSSDGDDSQEIAREEAELENEQKESKVDRLLREAIDVLKESGTKITDVEASPISSPQLSQASDDLVDFFGEQCAKISHIRNRDEVAHLKFIILNLLNLRLNVYVNKQNNRSKRKSLKWIEF